MNLKSVKEINGMKNLFLMAIEHCGISLLEAREQLSSLRDSLKEALVLGEDQEVIEKEERMIRNCASAILNMRSNFRSVEESVLFRSSANQEKRAAQEAAFLSQKHALNILIDGEKGAIEGLSLIHI